MCGRFFFRHESHARTICDWKVDCCSVTEVMALCFTLTGYQRKKSNIFNTKNALSCLNYTIKIHYFGKIKIFGSHLGLKYFSLKSLQQVCKGLGMETEIWREREPFYNHISPVWDRRSQKKQKWAMLVITSSGGGQECRNHKATFSLV